MIQDRLSYLNALGTEPWSRENHCWELVRRIRRDLFGHDDLPPLGSDLVSHPEQRQAVFEVHPARLDWVAVEAPQDGDVVIMTKPHDLHAGIYLTAGGRGRIWHTDIGHNLVADTPLEATTLRRWKLRFYRRK